MGFALIFSIELLAAPIVKKMDLSADGELSSGRLQELLGVRVGDEFSEAELDKGLKRLSNTGRYQGLEISFNPKTGRLALSVKPFDVLEGIQITFSNTKVSLEHQALLRKDILEISSLSIKDQIAVDALPTIRSRIQARMEARGFQSSQVILALQEGEQRYARILLVNIKLGNQKMLQALRFKGFQGADLEELRSLLESAGYTKPFLKDLDTPNDIINNPEEYFLDKIRRLRNANKGKPVQFDIDFPWDQTLIAGSLSSWGKRMRQGGFFDFDIQTKLLNETGKSILEISLNRGQQYDIQIFGNVNYWERDLRSKILDRPIRLGIPFNLNDAKNIVKSLYRTEGFRDVTVTSTVKSESDRRSVLLEVKEGSQYYLGDIAWEGITERERRELLPLERRWKERMSNPFHHIYFDEKQIKAQLPSLVSILKSEGYLQSRFLGFSVVENEESESNKINIKIPLQLGPRFKLRNISLIEQESLRALIDLEDIPLKKGEYASLEKILSVSSKLKEQAQEKGFLLSSTPESLEEIVSYSDSSDEVDLAYRLTLGPRVRMGQIVTEGLRKTREKVVLREFAREDLVTGSVWVPSKLEKIDERLLGYGLFNNLRMKASAGRMAKTKDDKNNPGEQERDLRILLSERPGGAVEFGPGYRTDLGLVVFGELNYQNLTGLNRRIVLRGQVSRKIENYQFIEQRYSLSLLEPYSFGIPLAARFAIIYEKKDDLQFDNSNVAVSGFNRQEVSVSLTLSKEIIDKLTLRLNTYTLSVPRIFDLTGSSTDAARYYRIATMGPQLEWDERNNIFNPSDGFLLTSNFEFSGPKIGSGEGVHFYLNKNEANYYRTLRKDLVLAVSASFSNMKALGVASSIPENRRLVLGGRTSIRSLPEKKLRFDQSGVDYMTSSLAKIEIRQGLFGDIGVAYFVDAGQVYARGFEGEGWREATGVGLRYQTPVGPLALDFAFNMDKRSGEDFNRILFSVGVF